MWEQMQSIDFEMTPTGRCLSYKWEQVKSLQNAVNKGTCEII